MCELETAELSRECGNDIRTKLATNAEVCYSVQRGKLIRCVLPHGILYAYIIIWKHGAWKEIITSYNEK